MLANSPHDPTEEILKVLEIIGYEEDREKFTKELLKLCEKQAFINLVKSLSNERQESLNQDLTNESNKKDVLGKYFNSDQKELAIQEATRQVIGDYIKVVMPTLSAQQLSKLEEHFKYMQPTAN